MKMIKIKGFTGPIAENKDKARELRIQQIVPQIEQGKEITLDFEGIELTTQSFIHALISEVIRTYGAEVLDRLIFKNCNEIVKKIIVIVTDYMQEAVFLGK